MDSQRRIKNGQNEHCASPVRHCARPTPIPALGRRRARPRVDDRAPTSASEHRPYPRASTRGFSSLPFPSSPSPSSRRAELSRAVCRRRRSRSLLAITPRSFAPRAARPHPETTPPFPDLGRAHPEPNRARRPQPPLPFFADLCPSPSTTLSRPFSA